MAFKGKVVTTYGDLRVGESLIDKSGNSWHVFEVDTADGETTLGIGSHEVEFATHHITKPADDEVTVVRAKTHVEQVAEAEAEVDEAQGTTPAPEEQPTTEQAVETLAEEMGAEVIAEQSAAEADALADADEKTPAELPDFTDFTDLEKRSHLYLVHGIYAHDVKFRDALVEMHDEAHADPAARFVPHVHSSDTPFPTEAGER